MQLQPPPFPTSPQSPNDGGAGSRDPNPFLHQGNSSSSSTSRPSPSQQQQQQFDEPPPRRSSPPPRGPSRQQQQQQQQVLPPRQSPPSATVPRGRYSAPPLAEQQQQQQQQQQYQQQRRWRSQDGGGGGSGSGSGGLVRPASSGFEEHRYDATELQPRVRRSSSDQRLDRRFDGEPEPDPDRRRVTNTPGRYRSQPSAAQEGGGAGGSGRPLSVGRSRTGRTAETRRALRKRSQSVGDKMALVGPGAPSPTTFSPQAPAQPNLLLYHVSRPEPRARWVFNLSKHTNVTDSGPPPETITSTIDKKRPNLGGLVWVNAVAGSLHCCLQKGVKNKAVTPVPANVLDGWLNGQTGLWWIGALKEGHRALWDSHVVMNWAMVFIPSSPEIAAKNNMEVWHDKCLPGSLRVARPGELTRKILDIVADDQDKEPSQVVHTHLCILLAEGDDLELKRPRMFSSATTPSPGETPTSKKALSHSRSISSFDLGPSLEKNGLARGGDASLGAITNRNVAGIEEALEKVAKYRERIVILKEDRRAKKALVDQLRHELEEKEATLSAENERLRLERTDIKDRAKGLWVDLENLRRDAENNAAENNISRQDREQLRKQVDRLRRERNSARADAMRWLEQQHAMSSSRLLPVGAGAGTADEANGEGFEGDGGAGEGRGGGIFPKTPGPGEAGPPMMGSWAQTAPGGSMTGMGDGGMLAHQVSVDQKAAATIAKLKNKVNRLRRERDDAEVQASNWLKSEQERMALNSNSGSTSSNFNSSSNSTALIEAGPAAGGGGGGGSVSSGGPVVASLKAESLQLKKELQNARAEAERFKRKLGSGSGLSPNVAPAGSGGSARGLVGSGQDEGLDDSEPQEARLALGRLLGQALNLLDPQAAADAVAVAAKRMSAPEVAAAAAAVAPLSPAPLSPQGAAGTMKLSTGEVSTSSTVQTSATEALSPQSVHEGTPPRAEEELEAAAMASAAAGGGGGKAFVAGLKDNGLTGGEKKEVGASGAASNGAAAAASNGGGGAAAAPALSGVKAAVAAINISGHSAQPREKEVGRHPFTAAGLVGSKTTNME